MADTISKEELRKEIDGEFVSDFHPPFRTSSLPLTMKRCRHILSAPVAIGDILIPAFFNIFNCYYCFMFIFCFCFQQESLKVLTWTHCQAKKLGNSWKTNLSLILVTGEDFFLLLLCLEESKIMFY